MTSMYRTRGWTASLLASALSMLVVSAPSMAQTGSGFAQQGRAANPGQSPLSFENLLSHSIERLVLETDHQGTLNTSVMLGDRVFSVVLRPHSLRSPDFQVLVALPDGTDQRIVPPPATTYRGEVVEVPGSQVTAGYFGGSLSAIITLGDVPDQVWIVQPLAERLPGADPALHVVHRQSDDTSLIGGSCGTVDGMLGGLAGNPAPKGPGVDRTLRLELGVDTDNELYLLRGSSEASVISAVETLINSVSAIYERDVDTVIEITTIIVRPTGGSPYTSTSGSTLLNQMTNHWRASRGSVRRDTASLISGKNFDGGTLGVAWLSGTCTTTLGYNVNQYVGLGTSARVAVVSHEIGHNNSAPHCSGSDCRIMCAGIGGCSGDITRFGAASRSTIRGFLETRPCIDEIITDPDPQPLPFQETFDASGTLDPDRWAEATAVMVTTSVINPISAPRALSIRPGGTLTTHRYIVPPPGETPTYVTIWSQHRFVESGKFLRVEYFSTFNQRWEPLGAIISNGTNQTQFVHNQWELPLLAAGSQFRLRITAVDAVSTNAWFIDDVEINRYCRVDLNQDGATNIFDFLAFQTFFGSGSPKADFNNDTVLDVFDFLEFQNQFSRGCQ
ncbi:MAG: hypothetical protein KIT54_11495 [Phycisphaeraceae bacterium]|nr:hypothetical protein [Phycisphaeraceae bacterium]